MKKTFGSSAQESIAANYRRLKKSKAAAGVFAKLKRHGCSERDVQFLLRNLARIPGEWRHDNEPWAHAVKRRARLAKKLRSLADEIAKDPDLRQLSFGIHTMQLNGPAERGMVTFAQLLRDEAWDLDPDRRTQMPDGSVRAGYAWEQRIRPPRKPSQGAYVLRGVFDLLQACVPRDGKRDPRAPNREVEILAGVLLGRSIPPGTLTHLREKERRRYFREKQ